MCGLSGNFPDPLETFRTVWKLSRQIFYCLQYCCNIHILHFCKKSFDMYVAKAIYAVLAHICRESNLRTFGAYMSRKRFTHSVRKVFAREILPTGKFGLFVSLPLTWFLTKWGFHCITPLLCIQMAPNASEINRYHPFWIRTHFGYF